MGSSRRACCGRGDQGRPAEVGAVGQLVQQPGEVLLRGGEAHVDDVESLFDRPAEPGHEHLAAALVVLARGREPRRARTRAQERARSRHRRSRGRTCRLRCRARRSTGLPRRARPPRTARPRRPADVRARRPSPGCRPAPPPVAPPKAHSRLTGAGQRSEPGLLDRVGRKAPRGQFLTVGGVGRGRTGQPQACRADAGSIGCETSSPGKEPLVALQHAQVDLDQVRCGARRAGREHRCGGRVGTRGRRAVLRDDGRELRDVRGGLGDCQRVGRRALERRADQLVLRVSVDVEREPSAA